VKVKQYSLVWIVCFLATLSVNLFSAADVKAQNSPGDGQTISLSAAELSRFKQIALEKVDYFYYLLNKISKKSTSKDSLTFYMDEANRLFIDKALIQVKSKSGTSNRRPVREYLSRLKSLPYTDVTIEKFSAFFVSDLRRVDKSKIKIDDKTAASGNKSGARHVENSENNPKDKSTEYEGVIIFEQYFEGRVEGRIVYSDTTLKTIRVIVRIKEVEGMGINSDVLLGDIDVQVVK